MSPRHEPLRSWFPRGRLAAWRDARERRDPYGLKSVWRWPWLTSALLFVAFLVAFNTQVSRWLLPGWLAWIALRWSVGAVARRVRPSRVVAWELLPGGLHEVLAGGGRRVHPWEHIVAWEPTPEAVVVRTRGGTLPFAGRAADRRDLGRALEHHLAQPRAAGEALSAAEIASWLGLEEGESLRVGLPWWQGPKHSQVMLGLVTLLLLIGLGGTRSSVSFALPLFLLYWYLFARDWFGKWVNVSAYGLEGQGCRIGWDEVESAFSSDLNPELFVAETTVIAGERRIVLRGALRERVGEVASRVLAAKEAGATLPRLGEVPDSALSRAESQGLADLGLSRTD